MDNLKTIDNNNITDINNLKFYQWGTLVIISKRNSGKTVLIKNLILNICNNFQYNAIFLFSETGYLEKQEWAYVDEFYNTDQIDDKQGKIIDYQKKELEKRGKNKLKSIIIILDDIKINSKNSTNLNMVFSLGRHLNLLIIISTQYSKSFLLNPIIRSNIYQLFFSDLNKKNYENIYEIVITDLNLKQFTTKINEINNNFQFIMYDNNTKDRQTR